MVYDKCETEVNNSAMATIAFIIIGWQSRKTDLAKKHKTKDKHF